MVNFMELNNQLQLHADEYARLRGYSPGLAQEIVNLMAISRKSRLLDIGCGTGKNTSLVAGIATCFAIGIDIDEGRINLAKRINPHIEWKIANACNLPFEKDKFSAVEIIFAIQRFRNQLAVLREAYRVLESNGTITIATVSPRQLKNRLDFKFFPEALALELQRFSEVHAIEKILSEAGFTDITVKNYSEPFMPADEQWLKWVEEKPYSSLRQISEQDFESGLTKLRSHIISAQQTVTIFNEATIINAKKGSKNGRREENQESKTL